MPKQRHDTTRPEPPRDERPELTPERNVEDGVQGTFPASDPVASTATQGARTASPARMMRGAAAAPADDAVTVSARFADREAAKLAVETLVRDAPLDRQRAEIHGGGADGAVTVAVQAAPADASRVRDMLQRCGGAPSGR